jgi:hypothetical protein
MRTIDETSKPEIPVHGLQCSVWVDMALSIVFQLLKPRQLSLHGWGVPVPHTCLLDVGSNPKLDDKIYLLHPVVLMMYPGVLSPVARVTP